MATKKKLLQAAAGTAAAGGAGLNVEEVFSTYLYEGTGATQSITNDIDLSGEGGLVWIKVRNTSTLAWHSLSDTERGAGNILRSDLQNTQFYDAAEFASFNSDGFTIAGDAQTGGSGNDYASWTFRKAPKFFDVVTYTGTGSATTISHNLGSVPACIIVKRTDSTGDWKVYHRAIHPTNNGSGYVINLNLTNARAATTIWSSTEPTSTEFSISGSSTVNASGGTYVAYLFAHNDGDGDFGPTGDQDIIKCGSYTGNGSTDGPEIDLGFEPQWLLYKNTSTGGSAWVIVDNMRGITTGGDDALLQAQSSGAELSSGYNYNDLQANGFKVTTTADGANTNGDTYIYIAIRRGPMAVPTDATEVFAMDGTYSASSPQYYSGWPVDFWMRRYDRTTTDYVIAMDRLRGNGQQYLNTTSTNAESFYSTIGVGQMDGANLNGTSNSMAWMWKRAPSFFDVVAYTGNGTAGRTVSHNLGVAPEMIWVKRRDAAVSWPVFHTATGSSKRLFINSSNAEDANTTTWNAVDPTASNFTVGNYTGVNASGGTYIAYLFASLDGVSKVGSYTGNGSTQNIDCGFSSGARFILIKRTDSADGWFVHDTERGIVTGNDPYLRLNDTASEASAYDIVDPYSAGFTVNNFSGWNASGGTYIFYAIA